MFTTLFTYQDVHGCSPSCSHSRDAISVLEGDDLHSSSPSSADGEPVVEESPSTDESSNADESPRSQAIIPTPEGMYPTSPCCFPRDVHRRPYEFLLLAVRDRVVDDVCRAQAGTSGLTKFHDGFLFDTSTYSQAWFSTWKQQTQTL